MASIQESLNMILNIQEIDIKLIRLLRVKNERKKELKKIQALRTDIQAQVALKEAQLLDIKKDIRMGESHIKEIQERVVKFEQQAAAVKKMDEFNALTQEITTAGRERTQTELKLSDLMDKLAAEEDVMANLKENLSSTEANSAALENEIHVSIAKINEEGRDLLKEREKLIPQTQTDMFEIYERLLKNKKDRVVVPIENRTCSGCHIVLTAQHENLVRKGERLVFCEHCSRILFWQEAEAAEGEAVKTRRRRRVAAAT